MVHIAHEPGCGFVKNFPSVQRGFWGSLLIVGIVVLSGCTLFEGPISIDQAVARLIPNDPGNVSNADLYIGELEIQAATQMWVGNQAVPRTGGQRINESTLERLILIWRQNAPVP